MLYTSITAYPKVSMQKPPQLAADKHVDIPVKDTIFKAIRSGIRSSPGSDSKIRNSIAAKIHANPPSTMK